MSIKRKPYPSPTFSLRDQHGFILFVGNLRQIRRRFKNIFGDLPKHFMPEHASTHGLTLTPVVPSSNHTPYTKEVEKLKEKLALIPKNPGVYLFKNKDGVVIYVGKAGSLKSRVGQYFGHDTRLQIPFLISEAVDIDTVVTESEIEALFLENTLIKQYMPKYNIKLRDDKNYAFIKIDYSTQIPSISYVRKIDKSSKAKYFGPYTSAFKIKKTLEFVRKVFPYCALKEISKRPCFYYYLHRCPGVCIGVITIEEYEKQLERIQLFLSGKTTEIKKELKSAMQAASRNKKYEAAARLRDQLQSLELLEERQNVHFPARVDWDFVSVFQEGAVSCVNVFKVREGRLMDKENFVYTSESVSKGAVIQTFMEHYYNETSSIPKEIYIEEVGEDTDLVRTLLKTRASRNVAVSVPTRGKKLSLIKLGITNAQQFLQKWETGSAENRDMLNKALEDLKNALGLSALPRRIEGYDISNIQGTNPVGSMVVTKDGLPAKSEYRKFKINVKSTPDDFAMMREMLTRRFQHLPDQAKKNDVTPWDAPDLIVIDGGKGQLSAVVEIMEEHKIAIPIVGLAKRIEEIFKPHNSIPIILSHDATALHILQRLRDEAHRFAITFHRSLRSKQAVQSELDTIPGIGPKTKKLLKQKFGTVAKVKESSLEELASIVGEHKAAIIKRHL